MLNLDLVYDTHLQTQNITITNNTIRDIVAIGLPDNIIPNQDLTSLGINGVFTDNVTISGNNFQNLTANEKLSTNLIPYPILMGCEAGNPVMKAFVDHLVILNSTDFTAEMDFLGKANLWLQNSIINHKTIPLCGKLIGTQKLVLLLKYRKMFRLEKIVKFHHILLSAPV